MADEAKRPKHQRKDLEKVLQQAEARRWRVEKSGGGYFKLLCPCADKHMCWVALTPSNPNYAKDKLAWLKRQNCWTQEKPPKKRP